VHPNRGRDALLLAISCRKEVMNGRNSPGGRPATKIARSIELLLVVGVHPDVGRKTEPGEVFEEV